MSFVEFFSTFINEGQRRSTFSTVTVNVTVTVIL